MQEVAANLNPNIAGTAPSSPQSLHHHRQL